MSDNILVWAAIGGPILYLLLKAIARRMAKPRPATFLAIVASGCLGPFAGDFTLVAVAAVAIGVLDLLMSTRPVD